MMQVAGPAALIVAKVVKVEERLDSPHRLNPKDGLDLLRLLRVVDVPETAERLRMLADHAISGEVTRQAVDALRRHGHLADGPLARLAATALPAEDWDVTTQSLGSLVQELLEVVDASGGVPGGATDRRVDRGH